jgi:hypothetical protein
LTHVEAGKDILKTIDFPWPVDACIRQFRNRNFAFA